MNLSTAAAIQESNVAALIAAYKLPDDDFDKNQRYTVGEVKEILAEAVKDGVTSEEAELIHRLYVDGKSTLSTVTCAFPEMQGDEFYRKTFLRSW